jgi:hypothetical protein
VEITRALTTGFRDEFMPGRRGGLGCSIRVAINMERVRVRTPSGAEFFSLFKTAQLLRSTKTGFSKSLL